MANRYANLPGASKIKDTYDRINQGFDLVEQDVDQLRADLDQEIADREAAVEYVDQRVDNIIVGGGPDKDPELVDIRNLDPSYTPQREINVAGDVTRDMQAQIINLKNRTVAGVINVTERYGETKEDLIAAIDNAVDGDTLLLDNVEYEIDNVTISKSIAIKGINAKLKLSDGANKSMINITAPDVVIEGLIIDGNKKEQSGSNFNLIEVTGEGFKFICNTVRNTYGRCLVIQGTAKCAQILYNVFENNGGVANCNAITVKGSYSLVHGNIIKNHGNGWGIIVGRLFVDPEIPIYNVVVSNNIAESIDHVAIGGEHGSHFCSFIGNTIRNCNQGLKFDDETSEGMLVKGNVLIDINLTGIMLNTVKNCVVEGNYLYNINGSDGIYAGNGAVVKGNYLENVNGRGIRHQDNCSIEGNVVINPVNYAIGGRGNNVTIANNKVSTNLAITGAYLHESGENVIVEGNTLEIIGDGSCNFGIRTLSGVTKYIIKNNIVTGANSPISDLGSDPKIVVDNLT